MESTITQTPPGDHLPPGLTDVYSDVTTTEIPLTTTESWTDTHELYGPYGLEALDTFSLRGLALKVQEIRYRSTEYIFYPFSPPEVVYKVGAMTVATEVSPPQTMNDEYALAA